MLEQATAMLDEQRDRLTGAYGRDIGRDVADVPTPALLLDLRAAERNIERMAAAVTVRGSSLRPHVKAHKSPDLARLQVEAGAVGISTATIWEAMVMAASGLDDVFLVNTVAGAEHIRLLARLAVERRISVAVDDVGNARQLAVAARDTGADLSLVIEVDTGMDRAGVDTAQAAGELARDILDLDGVRLVGVTGYEGHCSMEDDVAARTVLHGQAMDLLLRARDAVATAGIDRPIVSAGGTRTWWLGASTHGVTELQAGTYVLMDAFHSGLEGDFEFALHVASTVISRPPGRLIVDAGSKTIADPDLARIVGHGLPVVRFDEEHGIFASSAPEPGLGSVVRLIPGYAPSTVNAFDVYHVIDGGVVTDIWPVTPRGPGHDGLASIT